MNKDFDPFQKSKECQKEDWATHKKSTCRLEKERRQLAKLAPRPSGGSGLAHVLSLNKADSQLKHWVEVYHNVSTDGKATNNKIQG